MTELEKSIDEATREFFTWKKKYNEIRLNHNLNYGNDVPLTIKFMLSREDPSHSVSITFYDNKVFYYGDMGTFVFGKDICNVKKFFLNVSSGNLGYIGSKLEASSEDIEVFNNDAFQESLCSYFKEDSKVEIDSSLYSNNEYEAMNIIDKIFSDMSIEECCEDKADILYHSKVFSTRFVYACFMLKWANEIIEENSL